MYYFVVLKLWIVVKKQLYIAYGININLEQMAYRCLHSKVVGTSEIKDFELEFRGVATIVPKENMKVPVLIWELDERDLSILNRYEGFPSFYRQEKMPFEMDGKSYGGDVLLAVQLQPPVRADDRQGVQRRRGAGRDEHGGRGVLCRRMRHEDQ